MIKHIFEVELDKLEFSESIKSAIEINDSEHFYIWLMTCVVLTQNEIWGDGYDKENKNINIYNIPLFFNDTEEDRLSAVQIESKEGKYFINFRNKI